MAPDGAAFNVIKAPQAPAGYLFIRELAFYRKRWDGRNRDFAAVAGYLVVGKRSEESLDGLVKGMTAITESARNRSIAPRWRVAV